jgi:hypothetical protein
MIARSGMCLSLINWFSLESYVDEKKLSFFGRIWNLPSYAIPFRILIRRINDLKYNNNNHPNYSQLYKALGYHTCLVIFEHTIGLRTAGCTPKYGPLFWDWNGATPLDPPLLCDGTLSEWFTLHRRVRQGNVLSTKLYLVFVNDLINELEDSKQGALLHDLNRSIVLRLEYRVIPRCLADGTDGICSLYNSISCPVVCFPTL